ncbi:MAG: CAP domain-containing protein [Jatrophihabitantaceae bacterium]
MSARATTAGHHTPARRAALGAVAAFTVLASAAFGLMPSAKAATPAEAGAAQAVLALLNSERAANHLPALGWSPALVSSARRHNLTMAAANVLSHQLPGEPVFSVRISQAGVSWHAAAENIGWTTDRTSHGADSLEISMYNERPPSDGHRLNILSTAVHYVGIDTYIDSRTGTLWLTEDFADVAGPLPVNTAHLPIGSLDSATALPGHKVRLTGWAMDPDAKTVSLYIGIFYDGHFAGYLRAPVARPDVTRAKGAGPHPGYLITLTLPAGRHAITTYAVNVGTGSGMARLGSLLVTV